MSFTSLPPELVPSIASHLPPLSLARFLRVSSAVHALALPTLYRHVRLSYPIRVPTDPDPTEDEAEREAAEQKRQREVVRRTLERLAGNEKLCRAVRVLEVWNYSYWMEEETAEWVVRVIEQAEGLVEVRLLQDDDGAPFDPLLTPLENFGPVWTALRRRASLRALRTAYGPNVVLRLDAFPALSSIDMAMYYVDLENDGTFPASLRKLRLEYVTGFEAARRGPAPPLASDERWFRPSLFGHLESLKLCDLPLSARMEVADAVSSYVDSFPTRSQVRSPLRSLTLDFYTDPHLAHYDAADGVLLLLLSTFGSLNSITHLSVASSPPPTRFGATYATAGLTAFARARASGMGANERIGEPTALLLTISTHFARTLEALMLSFGDKADEFVGLRETEAYQVFRLCLGSFERLEQFQTNLVFSPVINEGEYDPSTPYVVLPASRLLPHVVPVMEEQYADALAAQGKKVDVRVTTKGGGSKRRKGWGGFWEHEELRAEMLEYEEEGAEDAQPAGPKGVEEAGADGAGAGSAGEAAPDEA
ncbi:hypothetical protein JCM10207_000639 [Rhodosporidiobolus poonsookiae]